MRKRSTGVLLLAVLAALTVGVVSGLLFPLHNWGRLFAASGAPAANRAATAPEPTGRVQEGRVQDPPLQASTVAPTVAPDTATVLYDTFSAGCALKEVESERRSLKCVDGEYTMASRDNLAHWVYYPLDYADCVIEADARAVAGPATLEYGIVFRISLDGEDFYGFTVRHDGKYSVFRRHNKRFTNLITASPASAIKRGGEVNHLKVIAQGSQMAVYVNGEWLNTVSDSAFARGALGLMINNQPPDPNAKVAFDNVRVSQINRLLSLPTGPTPLPAR
ncbi:MAG: DUF1080 domain-containing protein [Chloroflexi bacterium]|nr:DUF1080 domain-containing protein [Chloroflexota bacterium]